MGGTAGRTDLASHVSTSNIISPSIPRIDITMYEKRGVACMGTIWISSLFLFFVCAARYPPPHFLLISEKYFPCSARLLQPWGHTFSCLAICYFCIFFCAGFCGVGKGGREGRDIAS
ncbi:hypothetical protein EJ04DRAFT_148132 [Polyplosphaeria fusca]|uniref:Uncharacterized protein n=1 Tax=Polyplosphaeria fusca TaxID=682080 RepID=A0A9P4UWH1_9PLEO|nr:hypothetical protein EJ04DRAFT_148132 [Polyplosphaeria fusca]